MRNDFIPALVEYIGSEGRCSAGFTVGRTYEAFFVEYLCGKRDSLHVRNDEGKIVDRVPFGEFRVITDPQGVLEPKEAVVRFIIEDEPDPLSMLFGKEYRAIGCDKDGFYLVMDESGSCYFYEASCFEIVSDPHDILSGESVYYSLFEGSGKKDADKSPRKFSKKKDDDYILVKLITGERMCIRRSQTVGVCHYHGHPGILTKNLVKNHECDIKNCRYLSKYPETTYWEAREATRREKREKRELKKQIKRKTIETDTALKSWAQNCADYMMMPIKVTSVKNIGEEKTYTIFYISEDPTSDEYMYVTLADMFTWLVGKNAKLRHVKDMSGRYAVI